MRKTVFLALFLLLGLVTIPQVHAARMEKFPTDHQNIAGYWADAVYGMEKDGNLAYAGTYLYSPCVEDYFDFNFSLTESDAISAVLVGLLYMTDCTSENPVMQFTYLSVSVWDGSSWHEEKCAEDVVYSVSGYEWVSESLDAQIQYSDVTDFIDSYSKVNNVKVRLTWSNMDMSLPSEWITYVDCVSVLVVTESGSGESEFPVGLGAGALLMGLVAVIAFSVKKRR